MSRSAAKQSATLYLGLFVIFFALFAREHQRLVRLTAAPEAAPPVPVVEPVYATPSQKIAELTKVFQNDSLFQVRADGLNASYGSDFVGVTFHGEDVFAEGHFAFREEWYTALDRLGALIQPFLKRNLRIEIIGHTDVGSAKERRPTDYGESDYALSFARAEWVARFLERRALIPIKERVKLSGAGATKAGRKVELRFTFDRG